MELKNEYIGSSRGGTDILLVWPEHSLSLQSEVGISNLSSPHPIQNFKFLEECTIFTRRSKHFVTKLDNDEDDRITVNEDSFRTTDL